MLDFKDYRNARYQGRTVNNKPEGIAIVIDINNLFCLSEWKGGKLNGPIFVVYPDSKIFCGRMKNN